MGGVARLRGRARRPADRRRADLRLRRRRRSRLLAGAVRARRGRRRAARRAQRDRPALGEPALRLARPPRNRLPLVARAVPAHVRARRPLPASTTSAASSPTGRSRRGTRRRRADAGGRAPAPSSSTRSSASSATCRLIAEDLGHITPPVYTLRDELGLPGMVVLLWAFRRRKRNPHNPANFRRNSVAYTSTHDTDTAVGWFAALTPRERDATGLDPREPQLGPDRARLLVPRRARGRPGAGRARPRQRGADEPSGQDGGKLALAARARLADPGAWRDACAASPEQHGRV